MILIVSSATDGHTANTTNEIARLGGEYRLLDLSRFPEMLSLVLDYTPDEPLTGSLVWPATSALRLSDIHVVWWRRPQAMQPSCDIVRSSHYHFALSECAEVMSGFWNLLDVFWINHPTRNDTASRKALQLEVARGAGLQIPRTLITNDPNRSRDFINQLGIAHTVYKAFSATEQDWRETRVLKSEELSLLGNVRHAPVIFQEYVPAKADLRITVVGDLLFAAAIYTHETSYHADFRVDMAAARVETIDLPSSLQRTLLIFMKEMELVYGAIDMRLTPDGEFIFLEVNPAGQWLFIEERTGQPITSTLARLMIDKDET